MARAAELPGTAGSLDEVLITPQLAMRPVRLPDHAAENRALTDLAQAMADDPDGVLQRCAEIAMALCRADSAGISILEDGEAGEVFRWPAAAGAFVGSLTGAIPKDESPCGMVIDRDIVLLFSDPQRYFPALCGIEPRVYESLLAPWRTKDGAVGTLWVIKHSPEGRFDAEDARLLESLARFAAIAHQTASALNIAQRRREELRESEARFRHMADSAPALIWMTDAQGRASFANMHHDHVFGRAAADLLGDNWPTILLPEDRARFVAAFVTAFAARRPFKTEMRVRDRHDSVLWLRCDCVPRLDDAGTFLGYTGCGVDITDARLAAAELEQRVAARTSELMAAEESLRQAQKMEAVGQLTGGIAHDFNNMLQGILGGLEIAERRIARGKATEAERYLQAARESADRAAALTQRLLAFSRRQRLAPKRVSPNELVANLVELIRRTVGPEVGVTLQLHQEASSVLCDPNGLESALLNLCINARDAMPNGGRLAIRTRTVRLSVAEVIGHSGVAPGEFGAISVTDTGVGMTPEVRERVFEPFFTTKPHGQGTGLGLSQVYGFLRQSGGLVRLDSTIGQGTSVHLLLPHCDGAAAVPQAIAVAPRVPERATASGTVLLVDDEAVVRGSAAACLREMGYRVLEAANGVAVLQLLNAGTQIDLLVTDVGLPGGMNGRQVAEAVQDAVPGVPVLFITGYAGAVLAQGAEVIGKPFRLDELARRVRSALTPVALGAPGAT